MSKQSKKAKKIVKSATKVVTPIRRGISSLLTRKSILGVGAGLVLAAGATAAAIFGRRLVKA